MDPLALVEGPSGGFERRGLARSDPKALPLGAVVAKSSDTSGGQSGAGKAPQPPQALSITERCLIELPPPPSDPPILVLFPTTLHLALALAVPPHTTILSGTLMLLTVLCSWVWGWELVSTAGLASGLTAGLVVGLGVRFWPVGIWGGNALLAHPRCLVTVFGCLFACAIIKWVLGIAVLGRSWPGASLGIALGLATLWKKGWWLYFHPECAALLFISTGTTADVFFGFLLASLVQVYHAQSEKPPKTESTSLPPTANGAQLGAIGDGIGMKWTPLTPPGIGSRRRNQGYGLG